MNIIIVTLFNIFLFFFFIAKELLTHLLEKDPGKRYIFDFPLLFVSPPFSYSFFLLFLLFFYYYYLLNKFLLFRYTAKKALQHPWVVGTTFKEGGKAGDDDLDQPSSTEKLSLSAERMKLKSSMNRAIDVQRDGVLLKPIAESTIAQRRKATKGALFNLELDLDSL